MSRSFYCVAMAGVLLMGCGTKDDPNKIIASGTIEATDVNVAAKVPGQILSLKIDEGSQVKAGDLIAQLDHSAMDIQLRGAQAAIDIGRSQLQLTTTGARKEDIITAEQSVIAAQANRKLAADELERARKLVKEEAATRSQLDAADTRFRLAQTQVEQADQTVEKIRHFARPEEISGAGSRLQQLEAARDAVRKTIDDSYVLSPVSGTVTHKAAEEGELIGQGATVATVTDLSKVYLMLYVTEPELPRVHLGQSVDVRVDGMPKKSFTGHVTYISPVAEFTPKNVQMKDDRVKLVFGVKVQIENRTGELKKGLPADATIIVK